MLYAPHYGPVVAVLRYVSALSVEVLVNDHGRPSVIVVGKRFLQVVP